MHTLTGIITSTNRLQTKNHITGATYPRGSRVKRAVTYTFSTHAELLDILRRLGAERNQYCIRGTPRDGLQYPTRRALENFEDVALSWVMLDIDNIKLPKPLQTHTYSDAHANYARTMLPTEFQGVRCVWQASASAGVDPSQLKMHLWFFLDRSVTCAQLRDWLRAVPHQDRAVLRAVQPLYTADPIGGPYEGVRHGILPGIGTVTVPTIVARETPQEVSICPRPADSANVQVAWIGDQRHKMQTEIDIIKAAQENAYMDAYRLGALVGAQEARETWNADGDWQTECKRQAKSLAAEIAAWPGAKHSAELYEARVWDGAQWGCGRERERLGKRSRKLEEARQVVIDETKKKALKRLAKSKGNLNALEEAKQSLKGQATAEELSEASGLNVQDIGDVEQFDSDKWQEGLKVSGKFGEIIVANDLNYLIIFKNYPGFLDTLKFNVRSEAITAPAGHVCFETTTIKPKEVPGQLTKWLGDLGCVDVNMRRATEVFRSVVFEYMEEYDPFIELINDATERTYEADTWLVKYLGCKDTPYVRAVGLKTLVAAVARAYQPGCQVDTMLVLQGAEGIGKTTTLKTLGSIIDGGYTQLTDMRSKDEIVALNKSVIAEMGELRALQVVREIEHFKAFMSVGTDRIRKPYAPESDDIPRRSIIIGTTNEDEYLQNGANRRVWPVHCKGGVPLPPEQALALWRDAAVAYRQGELWWLTDESVIAEQRRMVAKAREQDDMEEVLRTVLADKTKVAHREVMLLIVPPERIYDRAISRRVGRALRQLGWKQRKAHGEVKWERAPRNQRAPKE